MPFPSKYKDEFPDMLVEHMRQGLTFTSFAGRVLVTRDALYQWVDKYPEFKQAKQVGECASLFWHDQMLNCKAMGLKVPFGKKELDPKKMDITALIFACKTRHHAAYGEKIQIDDSEIKVIIEKPEK